MITASKEQDSNIAVVRDSSLEELTGGAEHHNGWPASWGSPPELNKWKLCERPIARSECASSGFPLSIQTQAPGMVAAIQQPWMHAKTPISHPLAPIWLLLGPPVVIWHGTRNQ